LLHAGSSHISLSLPLTTFSVLSSSLSFSEKEFYEWSRVGNGSVRAQLQKQKPFQLVEAEGDLK
jgi:hypothetical protein